MPERPPADARSVFIAGAGPVGLSAAVELARRGYRPRIVDPDAAPSPNSRALLVNARTLDLLEASGVSDLLLAAGHRVKRLVLRRNDKILAEVDLSIIPHKINFLLVLAQSETERLLAQVLGTLGVAVERGTGLSALKTGRRNALSLSSGEEIECDTVIGADGAHSLVRKTLGLGFPGETMAGDFGLADVRLHDWAFPFDTAVVTVLDTHIAPFIPMGQGFGRFISTRSDCLNSLPPDAKVEDVLWSNDFHINFRQVKNYQQGTVYLAGDAAHIHSPVGGRGMNLGIEDACWLAWLLSEGREAEYTALRHEAGAHVLHYTQRFTQFSKQQGLLRDLALRTIVPLLSQSPTALKPLLRFVSGLDTSAPPWL